jgi:hypothetical protein
MRLDQPHTMLHHQLLRHICNSYHISHDCIHCLKFQHTINLAASYLILTNYTTGFFHSLKFLIMCLFPLDSFTYKSSVENGFRTRESLEFNIYLCNIYDITQYEKLAIVRVLMWFFRYQIENIEYCYYLQYCKYSIANFCRTSLNENFVEFPAIH